MVDVETINMRTEFFCLTNRFPYSDEKSAFLNRFDERFQELCLDYFLCLESLSHWEAILKKDKNCVQEYLELRNALETELMQYIKATSTETSHSST